MVFFSTDKTLRSIKKTAPVFSSLLISTALFCYANAADAQLVDYGSLQNLFGEPVTTSATGLPQRASDVPVDMTIITADDIRHSGTRSIPQIIGLYVPGTNVLRGAENSYDVGIRGYQLPFQSNLLVLVDGRQVFVDDYSRTIWDNLPVNVDDIRQIEVIKGASSAFSSLFGSNAGDGVINIITYSPLYDKNNVANVTLGTQENISGDATGTVKGDGWGSKFSVGGMNAQEFDTAQGYSLDAPNSRPMHSYVANSSVIQLSPTFQVNTALDYSESRSDVADSVDGWVLGNQKTTSYSGGVGFNWQSPFGVVTNNNYFNGNDSLISEPSGDGFAYNQKTQLFVSQLQDQFTVGTQHTFRLGMEYRYQDFVYGYADEVDPISPDLKENNYSMNGLWLWQINDKLSLTNALRFDSQHISEAGTVWPLGVFNNPSDYSQTNNVWSGNSGIVYHATDKDTVGASYGRGVLLPSMISLGGNILQFFGDPSFPVDGEGNPQLKPTVVENYELYYTRKVPDIYSTVKISPYYSFTKDIISPYGNALPNLITDANGNQFQPEISANVGDSSAYGGEIELKGSNAGYRWAASYSLAHVKDQDSVLEDVDYQNSAPESQVRLLLGYTTGSWEFDGNGQWLSSTDMLRETTGFLASPVPIRNYYAFGGRVAYNINDHFTLALTGTDISQAYTQESPYPAIEQQVFLGLTGKF